MKLIAKMVIGSYYKGWESFGNPGDVEILLFMYLHRWEAVVSSKVNGTTE